MNHEAVNGAKFAAISVGSSIASIPLEDTTQYGQVVAILISIVSGVVSLVKLFKKKK